MDEQVEDAPGLSDQYARASPWPVFVVLGLVLGELGVVFAVPAVTVGGATLLAGSVVGILRESGYAATLWVPTGVVGAAYGALGAAFLLFTNGGFRGLWLGATGAGLLVVAAALALYESGRV